MKKRIYLSGPITGKPTEEAKVAFETAETAALNAGYHCYNPFIIVPAHLRLYGDGESNMPPRPYFPMSIHVWEDCMRVALSGLLDCDKIHMLPGWQQSEGAKLEHQIALALGMRVTYPEGEVPEQQSVNLTDLATELTYWSRKAFPEADYCHSLTKLSKRIDDVWEAATTEGDQEVALELAVCLMYIFDSASRLGINSQMLTEAFAQKLKENKTARPA